MTAQESSLMKEVEALILKSKRLKASLAVRRKLAKWFLKTVHGCGYRRRRDRRFNGLRVS